MGEGQGLALMEVGLDALAVQGRLMLVGGEDRD